VLFLMDQQARYDRVLLARVELHQDETLRHAPLMEFSPTLLPQMFAGVDAVIAARMHALILAATQGTPWVNLSRSVKMDALSDMLGVHPLKVSNLTADAVETQVHHALDMGAARWQLSHDPALRAVRSRVEVSRRVFDERVGAPGRKAPANGRRGV
jgi:polysaccharide pyruvyl transferase WcaK-like protein